jgi:hypothetical protein
MAVLAISAISFIIYNIMDALSLPQSGKDKKEHPIRKRFVLSNIFNMFISLVVTSLAVTYNREWLTGLLRTMWALILVQFIYLSWSSSLKLVRTMRAMSASAGQVSKKTTERSKYWKSLKSLTALMSVVIVGLAVIAAIKMIDTEESFFPRTPAFGASSVLADVVKIY